MRKRFCLLVWPAICLLWGAAGAEVTFEIIGEGYATSVSADGSVVVGNTVGEYETFRWTAQTGIVRLGRATLPVLGVGAGAPDVSADGTRVSATILGADSTYATQGRWTQGSGWQEMMPPLPPGGGLMDQAYGSAWGLSDDGETVVGLYWRPGQPGGLAHASAWTEATGVVDLGSSGADSRANDANGDGSVIVGWDANPDWGGWRPAAWVSGALTILGDYDAFCEASAVTPDGTMIVGQAYEAATMLRVASTWHWNGASWDEQQLGALPGTFPNSGVAVAFDVTPAGDMVVGYNSFDGPFNATGFIWTPQDGLVDVEDFLMDNGVVVPAGFDIRGLSGVSDDGATLVGSGQDMAFPFTPRSFIIRVTGAASVNAAANPPAPALLRVLPNPTRGATSFTLDLARGGRVALEIFDSSGRNVRRLSRGVLVAGHHRLEWDGRDASGRRVAAGVYFARIAAGAQRETDKLTVVR